MREQHLTVVTDACRVDLKTYPAVLLLGKNHRQQQGYIALAGGRYALVVEVTERDAAGVLDRGEQVKAAQRQAVKLIAGNNLLQAVVNQLCTFHAAIHLTQRGHFVDRYMHESYACLLEDVRIIHLRGDEPIRRLAYYTQAERGMRQRGCRLSGAGISQVWLIELCDLIGGCQHPTAAAMLLNPGEYLQGGSKRVAVAGGEDEHGLIEEYLALIDQPEERSLRAAGEHGDALVSTNPLFGQTERKMQVFLMHGG